MNGRSVLRSLLLLALSLSTFAQEECQRGGCFPATGDLLVGRESKLEASSTCGLEGRERYCIVSFLDQREKCFSCQSTREVDSRPYSYRNSHLPKYMVTTRPSDRLKGWWQSVNGVPNVTITLNLESEFVFTHLIMTFKTFRPKAMYIERSWNYGRDWSVYRYFAFDCAKSFPNIPRRAQRSIDEVICEERYSKVEPSTKGEVVMKVLDPSLQKNENPYSFKVQNLLKLTNLRIRFTELHTLGDDVLGDSPEINQKYYYAMYEMVVRGSCSCYGHAEQCIPSEGTPANVDMVHGKCNCTHNTEGKNCERCKPGYNDEPWRPAYQDRLNVCKKCNCNEHSDKCHFDPAVYNATGFKSGGVCDDCQHNTHGRQCEQCKPLFYRDPYKNIFDPDVCKPCDCDPSGSIGGGECETVTDPGKLGTNGELGTVAGRCICKGNVEGARCDKCKDGFWNLLESNGQGCQSCGCDKRGTVDQDTCDQQDGTCRCKRFVKGTRCSKCAEGYWNLGSSNDGCSECGCDVGGARNTVCDDISGSCECRPNLMGRKCDQVRPGYYLPGPDIFEAEEAKGREGMADIIRKIGIAGTDATWTGVGYLRVSEGSVVDFTDVLVPRGGRYNIVLRYDTQQSGDWSDVRVKVFRPDGGRLGGATCGSDERFESFMFPTLKAKDKSAVIEPAICLEKGVFYTVQIDFQKNDGFGNGQTLIDSLFLLTKHEDLSMFRGREGNQRKQIYDSFNCQQYELDVNRADEAPEACKNYLFSIRSILNNGAVACLCDQVGTVSSGSSDVLVCKAAGGQCPCKPGVVGRRCDQCAAGYFGFGSRGCEACACDSTGSTSPFCHDTTGKCSCLPRLQGRRCNACPENHYDFPTCKPCQCSGHSSTCDPKTGQCTNCQHNTAGDNCDKCADGYYGDARKGTPNDCQRCQCPGGSSGNQFSTTCRATSDGKMKCDRCEEGYAGDQCEVCDDGYFGNPVVKGGRCIKCDCSNNVDPMADGKCSAESGKCKDCINNAAGDQCEKCKPGYFGNARNQTCRVCVCNTLGTEPGYGGICDAETGQCPCLDNVDGLQCDKCKPGFYNLASGKGCVPCNCDPEGSLTSSCNQLDGQCQCRVGFGGRSCNDCENFYWGNPKVTDGCKACNCNPTGSEHPQCNRTNGVCECKNNVVGEKCDMCAPRTSGVMPQCENCHTCNDQWEDILKVLEKNVTNLIKLRGNFTYNATEINLYTKDIKSLKDDLKAIEKMMNSRKVDASEVDKMRKELDEFRMNLMSLDTEADKYVVVVDNTTVRNKDANDELDKLKIRYEKLKKDASEFKGNVTKIIESNIGGALNSTRDSQRRSREAQKVADEAANKIKESKKLRKKIKKDIIMGAQPFERLDKENNELVKNLTKRVDDLEKKLKELNAMLCGGSDMCGGCTSAGCETCGGSGNGNCTGIKQLAELALAKAGEAKSSLLDKKAAAEDILELVKESEIKVNISSDIAKTAEESSNKAKKIGEAALKNITVLIKDITEFLNQDFNHPNISKALALETLQLNISLTPEGVTNLATQIRAAVQNLTGVDKILNESRKDYNTAINLKEEALRAKKYALAVMNKTQTILDTIASAMSLQNKTATDISQARADMNDVNDIIKQIVEEANKIDTRLSKTSNDTDALEKKRQDLVEKFDENRKELAKAENELTKAEEIAQKVNETSEKVTSRYTETKSAINKKLNETEHIRERVKKLGDGAIQLFETAAIKMQLLEELKSKYNKNEVQVQDLLDELRKLEIKAKYGRDRMSKISACHLACNADAAPEKGQGLCEDLFNDLDTAEKNELATHQATIDSRSS